MNIIVYSDAAFRSFGSRVITQLSCCFKTKQIQITPTAEPTRIRDFSTRYFCYRLVSRAMHSSIAMFIKLCQACVWIWSDCGCVASSKFTNFKEAKGKSPGEIISFFKFNICIITRNNKRDENSVLVQQLRYAH